jgi:hypothetical protein
LGRPQKVVKWIFHHIFRVKRTREPRKTLKLPP